MKFLYRLTSCFFILIQTSCSHLYYYPDSYLYYHPEKLPIRPTQYEFEDSHHRKLIGWYFRNNQNTKPKAKILFFHGNAQNISSHFAGLYWILKEGYDFFIFDYPGYGGSEGEPNRDSVVEAGHSALQWLSHHDPKTPIAILGQSLGGNVALYVTAQYQNEVPVCEILVDSTFLSYPRVARTLMNNSAWTWVFQWLPYLTVSNYKSALENITKISPTPLIVMHGDQDQSVRFDNGVQVFNAAHDPKEFWKVPGGEHIDGFTGPHREEFRKKYLEALKRDCSS